MQAALPFAMSLALLGLLGWQTLLSPQDLPIHDEGWADHLGMLLVIGQMPLVLLGLARRARRRPAALQSAALAAIVSLVALANAEQHDRVRARIEAARPLPGGEQAVRAFLASAPDQPVPAIRNFLERDGADMSADVRTLGAVRSIRFTGIDSIGWDIYEAAFDRGVRHIHLFVADDSRLLGITLADAPNGCLSSEVYDCRYLDRPYR